MGTIIKSAPILLAQFKRNTSFTENQLSYTDKKGKIHHYFYPIATKIKKKDYGIGPFRLKEVSHKNYFALVPTPKEDNATKIG